MSAASEVDLERLLVMTNGFRTTQVVYVMAKLGLADHLAESSLTAAAVASRAKADPRNVGRLLRMAAYLGLVTEEPGEHFRLTALGMPLRGDVKGTIRPLVEMLGEEHYGAWGALVHSVESGGPAFEHVYGKPLFDYMAAHPDTQATFDAAMAVGTDLDGSLTSAYDFSAHRVVVDVGGGIGSVSAAILTRNPHLEAVIFDQAHVLARAEELLRAAGVWDRCRLAPGSFFEMAPKGGDLYVLSNIIHDWDDERALRILHNCRDAMTPDATMMLMEAVLPPHGHPSRAAMADVNMMVMLTGQERTEEEYRYLLAAAGLRLFEVMPVSERLSLVIARPD